MKKHSIVFENSPACVEVFHSREGEMQKIGEIFDKTLVTKRNPAKHILRRYNAYGFNSDLINSNAFDTIVIIQEKPAPQLLITLEDAKTNAHVEMSDQEEQYFIPLDAFTVLK
jgi:hypothetical protein